MCLDHDYPFIARYEALECQRPTLVDYMTGDFFSPHPEGGLV